MNEKQALEKMVAPGTRRKGKYREGVIQILVTRACDKACYGCTQGSNLGGKVDFMPPDLYERALLSLKGYFGVHALFGGNPSLSPYFKEYCLLLQKHVPFERRGVWCNHPKGNGKLMRETFNPAVSNLNVHLDREAYDEFRRDWPECRPVGLDQDSRHSPPWVAMKDVMKDEGAVWDLISRCPINQHWSALIGMFRGELRAWFCEIAGAQSGLHQHDPEYPDTGIRILEDGTSEWYTCNGGEVGTFREQWWRMPMQSFTHQVRKHCLECGVPMQGYGELSQAPEGAGGEQVSATHQDIFKPKRKGRRVELVTVRSQLGNPLDNMVDYLGNARK